MFCLNEFLKIFRNSEVEYNQILHVAGGEHTGIVINKLTDGKPSLSNFLLLNMYITITRTIKSYILIFFI